MPFDLSALTVPLWLPVAWGLLVGLVFSLVGAAGGILASFGLISVIGLTDPNMVKPMAQALTLATPLVAVPAYYRQYRLVAPLALVLGLGGVVGALIGSSLSVRYLANLDNFLPVFAALVLVIAGQLAWSVRPAAVPKSHTARAVAAFEGLIATGGEPRTVGVRSRLWSPWGAEFEFGEEHFHYRPWVAFTVGMAIAILSSALGVGGGFLLVPFMALGLHLPMFVVAGTAALAIFVSSATSIANYLALGVRLDLPLLVLLLAGTLVGAWLGPRLSRILRDRWLKILLTLVLLAIALRYFGVL
jgi:uncharacterized protein